MDADNYDGIIDETETSHAYWTMNVASDNSINVWRVHYGGLVGVNNVGTDNAGARAVIEINK